jgi:hypothetical protein
MKSQVAEPKRAVVMATHIRSLDVDRAERK